MLLIGGGVLALVVANTLLSASRIADQDRQVRMLSPKFLGEDKGGRPYTVTAKDAVRDPAHMERITLNHPHLVLQSLNGDPPTIVDSILGLYNENSHMLALDGQVWLDDGKKDLFQSEHALVNTDAGTVDGRSPVVATGPIGRTTADTYRILDRGADVHFDGDVKSHLVNQ
jgi:hypothetical protein